MRLRCLIGFHVWEQIGQAPLRIMGKCVHCGKRYVNVDEPWATEAMNLRWRGKDET